MRWPFKNNEHVVAALSKAEHYKQQRRYAAAQAVLTPLLEQYPQHTALHSLYQRITLQRKAAIDHYAA